MPEDFQPGTNLFCTMTLLYKTASQFIDEDTKVGGGYITHLMSRVNNEGAGVCACMCVCLYVCTHASVCGSAHECVCLCVCLFTCMCLLVCPCVSVWVCLCVSSCMREGAYVWRLRDVQVPVRCPGWQAPHSPFCLLLLNPSPSFLPSFLCL